jgi:hypothetical protein
MAGREPAHVRQAKFRASLRSKGLREVKVWLPEEVLRHVASSVAEGRFESQTAAFADAIVRAYGQEIKRTGT